MSIWAFAFIAVLALLTTAAAASAFQPPNIIIKVKGGRATVSNKATPKPGYAFKRREGPCLSTHGYKCTIEGSSRTERFVVRLGKG